LMASGCRRYNQQKQAQRQEGRLQNIRIAWPTTT
jgi:hypothetical protein